ncbi:MAG: alpha/beta hydrolase [Planctomycetota bacterium]
MSVPPKADDPTPRPRRGCARRLVRAAVLALAALAVLGALATQALRAAAERRFPRSGELVEVEGLKQHVLRRGEGPPVVFVHGAYGGLQDFEATILDAASQRYHCVLWDRPGHGYSERPSEPLDPGGQARLLLGLVRELGLERPLLVGFSYGGAVCLAAGLEAPEELRGLLLLNAPSHPWPDPLDLEYRLSQKPILGRLLSETVTAPLGWLLSKRSVAAAFDPEPIPPHFDRSPVALALRPASYRANTEDIFLLKPFLRAQAPRYPELALPVLALVGTGDTVVSPVLHIPELSRAAPACREVRLEGVGHPLLYAHPERVLAALDEALGEPGR